MSKFTKVHASSLLSLLNDGYHLNLPTPGLFLARCNSALLLLADDSFDRASKLPEFSAIPSFSSITAIGGCLQGKDVLLAGFTRDFAKVRVKDDETEKLRRIKKKFLGFHLTRPRRSPRIAARSSSTESNETSFKIVKSRHVSEHKPPESRRMSVTQIRKIIAHVRKEKEELQAKRAAIMASRAPCLRPNTAQASSLALASARAEDRPAAFDLDDTEEDSADVVFDEADEVSEASAPKEPLKEPQERTEATMATAATLAQVKPLNAAPAASIRGPQSGEARAHNPATSVYYRFLNAPSVASRRAPFPDSSMRASEYINHCHRLDQKHWKASRCKSSASEGTSSEPNER